MRFAQRAPVVLIGAAFLTFFDRGGVPPMMTAIASDFGVGIEVIGVALTAHVVAYGLAPLAWSALSSRVGQLRMLRTSLSLTVLGSISSALAFDPLSLTIARAFTGAAFGATVPGTLVYFGQTVPLARRGSMMTNLATALALGMTGGTALASVLGSSMSWRWTFGSVAMLAVVALTLVWRLDPKAAPAEPLSLRRALRRILGDRWSVLVLALAVVEGIVLVGIISFLPVALESAGESAVLAGLVTAAFGIAVIVSAQVIKLFVGRTPAWLWLLLGGIGATSAYALIAVHLGLVTVITASAIFGFAWAAAHTQLQTWMTDAVSAARPVGTALFATAFFCGGALGAALGTALSADRSFDVLFALSAILSGIFTLVAVTGRWRYPVRGD